jgi:hypothetical protein
MNDDEIRIAIAEACGWKWEKCKDSEMLLQVHPPQGKRKIVMFVEEAIPDYHNDLNAMHEAEMTLTDEQYRNWCYHLKRIRNDEDMPICKCNSAPARQRAKAFLRTIGKWKEEDVDLENQL